MASDYLMSEPLQVPSYFQEDSDVLFPPELTGEPAGPAWGPNLTGAYAQSLLLSEIKDLTTNPASPSVLKHASDLNDGEEVAVRLMTRGPGINAPGGPLGSNVERSLPIHATLHHPNVLGIKRVFLSPYHLGVVQELASHGTLENTLRQYGAFSEKFARFFFQQLMCGVFHLHDAGVAHGNIKLRNLLLRVHNTADGAAPVLKIAAFDHCKEDPLLALPTNKSAKTSRSSSPARLAKGLSPIQESKAGDMWSCGVLLFTMLTRSDPFDQALAVSKEPREPPSHTMAPQYAWPAQHTPSAQCQDLVAQLLEADPLRRISVEQVLRHAWYTCDLPRELQNSGKGLTQCQAQKCAQGREEIKELLRQAKSNPQGFAG